jgi:hypothetical protein
MSYVLCCRRSLAASPADGDDSGGGGNSSTPTVVRLARIFGDLLFPLNFSFTDTGWCADALAARVGVLQPDHSSRAVLLTCRATGPLMLVLHP